MVKKETWKTIGLVVLLTALTTVIILELTGVFNPDEQSSSQDYSDFYDGTVQCRAKYSDNPYSFGKKGKGCYTCPQGYIGGFGDNSISEEGTPKCYPVIYNPALSQGKYLSCQGYNTETHMAPPSKDQLKATSDVHYPNVCDIVPRDRNKKGNYINATRLGNL